MKRLISLAMMMAVTIALPIVPILEIKAIAGEITPENQPDNRVKSALDKLNLKYEITKSGNFKVVFTVKDGRTQVVNISSKTEKVKGIEIRELTSPGYLSTGPLSADIANRLLVDSYQKKLGAWSVLKSDTQSLALFVSKIDVNTSPEDLSTAMQLTVYAADEIERSLTNEDKF
jgi:hypothetical protein